MTSGAEAKTKDAAGIGAYIAIARLDHVTKHVFILPGIVLAYGLRGIQTSSFPLHLILGFLTAVFIASANYVINEYLDRESDRHHPTKSGRTANQVELKGSLIALEWLVLVGLGLACAYACGLTMVLVALVFAAQGLVYNVPPIRSKDKAYLDVVSESINNPLRLMIGWAMVDPTTLPPSSILLAYWFGGAFLMAAKRLSEYREIVAKHGRDLLVRYRASFANYSEISLTVSCLVYAVSCSFFLGIYLIKYRIEYLLTFPAFAALFGVYLALSMQPDSVAQKPEKLFREPRLMAVVAVLVALFVTCTFVNMEFLHALTEQDYVRLQ